jgi:tyrosyl-tRNA synthetase
MKLAYEIVSIYHSPEAAELAQQEFIRVFQQGDLPEEMPEYTFSASRRLIGWEAL